MTILIFCFLLVSLLFIWIRKNKLAVYFFSLSFIISIWVFIGTLPLKVPL